MKYIFIYLISSELQSEREQIETQHIKAGRLKEKKSHTTMKLYT